MKLTLIHKDMLRSAIAFNTDASEEDAKQIINAVLLKQRDHHSGECADDRYARDVCDGMWEEKCDDVIALCEALRAVLALAGEVLVRKYEGAMLRETLREALTEAYMMGAQNILGRL